MPEQEKLIVTQSDREAAADYYYSAGGSPKIATQIREGKKDDWFRVHAFARHRLVAAREANDAGLSAIRDMMVAHVLNWPDPKKLKTAIALVDKTLHAALARPGSEGLVEWVLVAMSDALRATCTSRRGCYAVGFTGFCSQEGGWRGEVDGEIDLEPVARAASPNASITPEPAGEEMGWLIEMVEPEENKPPVPRWWHPEHGWMWDANKALRFAREIDAADHIKSCHLIGKPTQHRWM